MVALTRPNNKKTGKKAACLKCLVVPLKTDKIAVTLIVSTQICLQTYWFDVRGEGKALSTKQFTVHPNSTLYFVASRYTVPDHPEYRYFFILQHSDEHRRFACSCPKGWDFNRTQAACEHMEYMNETQEKVNPSTPGHIFVLIQRNAMRDRKPDDGQQTRFECMTGSTSACTSEI